MQKFIFVLLALPALLFGQDSLNVTRIGYVELSDVWQVMTPCYHENYIYAPEQPGGVHVVNAINLSQPVEVDYFESDNILGGAAALGNYLYVTDWDAGLRVFSLANPAHPIEIGQSLPRMGAVEVFGSYLFLMDIDAIRIVSSAAISTSWKPVWCRLIFLMPMKRGT